MDEFAEVKAALANPRVAPVKEPLINLPNTTKQILARDGEARQSLEALSPPGPGIVSIAAPPGFGKSAMFALALRMTLPDGDPGQAGPDQLQSEWEAPPNAGGDSPSSSPERRRACSNIPMRTFSRTTITGAVFTTLLACSAFARDHSSLNGVWTLVPAKSDFAGQPVVQTGTVTIHDREGVITVSRSFKYEGATETFFYSDITDAERNATIHDGKDLKSKTSWDHGVLKVKTTESGAVTLESYALAPDGAMTVSVMRPNRKPITLLFQRQ